MTTPTNTPVTTPAEGAAPAAVVVPEDTTGYTQMSSAFDELVAPSTTAVKAPDTVTAPAALEAAAAAVKAAADAGTGEAVVPATGTTVAPVAGDTTVPVTTDATATAAAEDWKAKYDELVAAKAKEVVPPQQQAVVEKVPEQVTPAPAPAVYTPEEQTEISEYQKEWPGVSRGEALIRRAEYTRLLNHVFSEVKRVYDPLVQRAMVTAEDYAMTTMVGEIRKGHADYSDALHDEVVAWTGTLKGMKRLVAERVIEQGEAQDVIDLITDFKQATGKVTPTGGTTTPVVTPVVPAVKGNVTDISEAAKKAAAAMGVVDGKRTAVTAADDPNDFDGTWAKITADAAK